MAKTTLLLALILPLALSIRFSVNIPAYETQCFYEQLGIKTKYAVEIIPEHSSRYLFTISDIGENEEKEPELVFSKEYNDMDPVRLNKFSPKTSYYSFCTRNILSSPLQIVFELKSGLDLMELDILPDKSDNEYLDKEVEFLADQQKVLFESLNSVENARSNTQALLNMMSTKTVYFGIVGFLVILIVNVGFLREVRKNLKDRKLI